MKKKQIGADFSLLPRIRNGKKNSISNMGSAEEGFATSTMAKKPYFGMTGTTLNAWVTVSALDSVIRFSRN